MLLVLETASALIGVVTTWISGGEYSTSDLPMDMLSTKSGAFPSSAAQKNNKRQIIAALKRAGKK